VLTDNEVQSLLEAAVAAPSADNHHGWRLQINGARIELRLSEVAADDHTRQRLTLISIGAVAESLRIRATRLGLRAEVQFNADDPYSPFALQVSRAQGLAVDRLDAGLAGRHSNRTLRFSGPKLTEQQQAELQQQAGQVAGSWLRWLDQPELRSACLPLIRRAEVERFRNPVLHAELFSAVRFDAGWAASCAEGLPPASLGVHPLERPGFSMMRHWGVQRVMNLLGAHHMLGMRSAALPARLAPHVVVIGARGAEVESAFQAGRLLLRVWTEANALGLAAQVLAASPVYALPDATAVPRELQTALAKGWRSLCPDGTPWVVLRLGRAPAPAFRAGRPSPAGFLA
jgi:hypothetical protein